MALKVSVTARDKSVFVVFVSGSIDTNTYTVLEKELAVLLAKSPKVVVIDMKDVPYISSMGLSTILKSKKDLEKQGGTFLMVNLQPQVKKVFDIIKALPPQIVFTSIEELDSYLAKMQGRDT